MPDLHRRFRFRQPLCESCGGTCFYENTVEENDAYVAALGTWLSEKNQQKIDEMTENERRSIEETKRVKASMEERKRELYGATGTRNPIPNLRKMTGKLRKHRCAWDSDTPEGHLYRCSHAEIGGTFFSVIRNRTSSWMPQGRTFRAKT